MRQEARNTHAQADFQRRARSKGDCPTVGATPEEVRQLDRPAVGGEDGRVGNRGIGQPRDSAAYSQKNGMSQHKIQYWVIPPEARCEFVANMEEALET